MRGHKFFLFSHHQFNTRLRYVHAVPFLVVKFFTMFFSWTVVFHLWGQFSKKGEMIQFSRYPPLAWITLWDLPSRDSAHLLYNSNEWNITVNQTQALFLLWRMNYWILCSLSFLERYYCAGKHRLGLGFRCSKDYNVSAALQLAVFAHTFMASLGYWMGNIDVARWNGIHFLIPKHL